jgi:hypothetical protein
MGAEDAPVFVEARDLDGLVDGAALGAAEKRRDREAG